MPEIAAIAPVVATAPAAPSAPTGPVASVAQTPDGAAQDFLSQLKVALKTLAGVVTATPAPAAAAPVVDAGLAGAPTDPSATTPADDSGTSAKTTTDQPQEVAADLLLALGALLLPTPQTPPPTPVEASSATNTPGQPAPPLGQPAVGAPPLTAQAQAPFASAQLPSMHEETSTLLAPETVSGGTPTGSDITTASATTAAVTTTSTTKTSSPTPVAAPPSQPTPASATQTAAAPLVHDAHAPAPTQGQPLPSSNLVGAMPQAHTPTGGGGAFGQSTDSGDNHASHGDRSAAISTTGTTESAPTPTGSVVDQNVIANAAAASAAPVAPNLPANIHPGDVVAQIAHQANLYQLPGNKGVRIQLRPEDLGGVEVTVRYASGGALELHINVEHAATGALVQQGWTQLRDALATQGISPDRLVMSITGPASAGQLDFSANNGGGGSYRSDPGLAGFAQQQGDQSSGQQRDNTDQSRATGGWNSTPVATNAASEDTPRSVTTSGSSRIDYRV